LFYIYISASNGMKKKVMVMLVLIIGGIIGLGSIQYSKAKNMHRGHAVHATMHKANHHAHPKPRHAHSHKAEHKVTPHKKAGGHVAHKVHPHRKAPKHNRHHEAHAANLNHKNFGHFFHHNFPGFWPYFFSLGAWVHSPYWPHGWEGYVSFGNDTHDMLQIYYGSRLMTTLHPGQNVFLVQSWGPFSAVAPNGESVTYRSEAPFILISDARGELEVEEYGYNYTW
jgi:hypothetical protein